MPLTVWLIGDSQLDGLIDWVSERKDPTVHVLDEDAVVPTMEVWTNGGTEFRLVDLAAPACEGGSGTARVHLADRAVDESATCLDWRSRWSGALEEWSPPDVVVWMVGGATVWIARSFVGSGDIFRLPVDPEWREWWLDSVRERLDWLEDELPGDPPILWTTPVVPNRDEYARGGGPDDERWHVIVAGADEVARLQRSIVATRPGVRLVELEAWVATAGVDGGRLRGTFDGSHWGKRATYEQLWPFLFSQVRASAGL